MPLRSGSPPFSEQDLRTCRSLLRDGSRTFLAASWVLPRDVADSACALYAFCRVADDRVDADRRPDALRELRDRLERIYDGRPHPIAADRAFSAVVRHHGLPREWPGALLEGFEWDLQRRQYEDLDELHAYAARVAGSVGAMMARVMGSVDPAALARACELGIAMQLTNIARDVGEDARLGRLYLPRAWMRDVGLDPDAWLAEPAFGPQLAQVVRRLLDEADRRYRSAAAGIGSLPFSCRPGIRAAGLLYGEIGEEVRRRGFDSVSGRAVVGSGRKARLLSAALLGLAAHDAQPGIVPSTQIGFLVDAGEKVQPEWARAQAAPLFLLDLYERLERRDRQLAGAG